VKFGVESLAGGTRPWAPPSFCSYSTTRLGTCCLNSPESGGLGAGSEGALTDRGRFRQISVGYVIQLAIELMAAPTTCNTPSELSDLGRNLPRLAEALSGPNDVTIVAIGSSSTEGDGASSKAASYPSRLNDALSGRFPNKKITVLNVGVGGQEAPDEAARFKKDVLASNPSLVIWQVGTNAAWKDYFLEDVRAGILRGLDHLSGVKTDVILMNLQYAPALLDQEQQGPTPATQQMQDIIARIASDSGVALFRRFEIMRYWRVTGGVTFEQMISNFDGNWLHQNDWSYNCIAQALCDGIVEAVATD
jgi:acyl-CoA thioesterase I